MKLRSLFLAGIAAFAMASCSNEVEGIDNGDNGNVTGAKDAIAQFGIAFANSNSGVRATTNGESTEQDFTDATIVIKQGSDQKVYTFAKKEFKTQGGSNILWLKEGIEVKSGTADVYVFLNASTSLQESLKGAPTTYNSLEESVNFNNGIAALTADGMIAESGHFLMSNTSGEAVTRVFEQDKVNELTVPVSRVAAKLIEKTPTDNTYPVAAPDEDKNEKGLKVSVKLTNFTYAGLAQATSVMKGGNVANINLFKPFDSTAGYTFEGINGGFSSYCMENLKGTSLQTTTNVIYKGKITVADQNNTVIETTNVYVTSDNYLFTSVDEMVAAGRPYNDADELTIQQCLDKYGLKKYQNGECYYVAQIKTNATDKTEIVRNNIYELSVKSIAEIGSVLPKTPQKVTLLNLIVEETPWTVNTNEFPL